MAPDMKGWTPARLTLELARLATWRSGDAADCKSVYPGSIPGVASNTLNSHSIPRLPLTLEAAAAVVEVEQHQQPDGDEAVRKDHQEIIRRVIAAGGHIYQTVTAGNYAPYNFLMIFSDGFIAVWLLVLLYLYHRCGGFQRRGS